MRIVRAGGLFYPAALDADMHEHGKAKNSHANKNCSDIHAAPPFLFRCHPTNVEIILIGTASQLAGEITAPTRHPAPTVRKKSSQYFIAVSRYTLTPFARPVHCRQDQHQLTHSTLLSFRTLSGFSRAYQGFARRGRWAGRQGGRRGEMAGAVSGLRGKT